MNFNWISDLAFQSVILYISISISSKCNMQIEQLQIGSLVTSDLNIYF